MSALRRRRRRKKKKKAEKGQEGETEAREGQAGKDNAKKRLVTMQWVRCTMKGNVIETQCVF